MDGKKVNSRSNALEARPKAPATSYLNN